MNAYGRNYRQEKALDKDIRSLIVDTILVYSLVIFVISQYLIYAPCQYFALFTLS